MEVDATPDRHGRDVNRLPSRERVRGSDVLALRIEVLDHIDVGERMDLRRDREAHPVPRRRLWPRAVDLREVHLRAADERRPVEHGTERRAHEIDELRRRRLLRRRRPPARERYEDAIDRRSAVERLGHRGERVRVLGPQLERDLQLRAGATGCLLRSRQGVAPAAPVEPRLNPHVRGTERADQLRLVLARHVTVAVEAEADRGNPRTCRCANREPDRTPGSGPRLDAARGHGEPLHEGLSSCQRVRETERDRRRVRLEVRVGPVAVILGLPQIAFELEEQRSAAVEQDVEPVVGREQRIDDTVDDRLRPDQGRELPFDRPLRRSRPIRAPGRLAPGVMDTQADSVVLQIALRAPLERGGHLPSGVAADRPVPREVDVVTRVPHVKADVERVIAGVDFETGDRARNGVPVPVTHCRIDATDELGPTEAHVAKIDTVEEHRHGACAQKAHLGRRLGRAVQQGVSSGSVDHRRSPPASLTKRAAARSSFARNSGESSTAGFATSAGTRPAATASNAPHAAWTHSRNSCSE